MLDDLSGSNAATSSIFLNCHGNRDGYRNGRISKPADHIQPQIRTTTRQSSNVRLSSGLYASYVSQNHQKNKIENPRLNLRRDMTV